LISDNSLDDTLCAISTILLESAKTRSNEEQLKYVLIVLTRICSDRCYLYRSVLIEHGVNSETANILTVLYGEHKDTLVQYIDTTG
jgi:hypothetical protein